MRTFEIDKMVDRFLAWPLPQDFTPDGGISFRRESDYDHPEFGRTKYEPVGTNLLSAEQAKQMFLHCLGNDCPECAEGEMDTEDGILGCGNCGYSPEA